MEQAALFTPILCEFKRRSCERPCTRIQLEALEREFEGALRQARMDAVSLNLAGVPDATLDIIRAVGDVRVALRRGIEAHDRALSAVLQMQELVARGHIREAVMESVKVRQLVAEFSDLSLDFIADAEVRNKRRNLILMSWAVVAAVGFLVVAIVVEFSRRV